MSRVGLRHRRRESDRRGPGLAHVVARSAAASGRSAAPVSAMTSSIMRVIRRRTSLVHAARPARAGVLRRDLGDDVADERDGGDIVEREQIGAQAVVDVMGVVGDVVDNRRDLRFRARLATTVPRSWIFV